MSALAFWQSLSSPSRCSLGICQLFSTSPSPPSTAAGPTGPSIAQGAPLVGLGSTPAVEDLPLRHLGWCGHRDRTASAASATAAAVSTAAVSTAVSTAIATAHRRPPGTAAGAARRVQGGQERPLSTFSGLGALKWLWVFAGVWLGPLGPLADAWKAFGRELCRRLSACRWLCENETVECLVCGPI